MVLRKTLVWTFLVAMVLTLISGALMAAAKQTVIVIGNWPRENDPIRQAFYEEKSKIMLEKYNVKVIGDTWQYSVASFFPKAAAGKLPTVYNTWFTEPGKIVDAGYAADATAAMKKLGWYAALDPQIRGILSKNGKIYAVPIFAYVLGLQINVGIFRKAGLLDANGVPMAPKTYEELANTSKIIRDKTGTAGFGLCTSSNCGGWHFQSIAWSFGAEFEKKVNGKWKAVFNSPEAVAALQYVKDLKWKYNALPETALIDWAKGQELIGTDQVAMKFNDGTSHGGFNFIINNYKVSKDNIALASMPAGPKGRYALMGGDCYMFDPMAKAAQIEAGLRFIELIAGGPKVDATSLKSMEELYKTDVSGNFVVGAQSYPLWINPDRIKAENTIWAKYVNVNLDFFKDYNNYSQVKVRAEEPVNCQDLYATLDGVIQSVLTDKNADPKALLDKAVAAFQKDFLDKAD